MYRTLYITTKPSNFKAQPWKGGGGRRSYQFEGFHGIGFLPLIFETRRSHCLFDKIKQVTYPFNAGWKCSSR